MPRKRHRNRHREKRPATARSGEMSRRRLVSLNVLAVLATVMLLTSMPVAGQASSAGPKAAPGSAKPSADRPWTPPRTPWGEPDLQGVWDYRTITAGEVCAEGIAHGGRSRRTGKAGCGRERRSSAEGRRPRYLQPVLDGPRNEGHRDSSNIINHRSTRWQNPRADSGGKEETGGDRGGSTRRRSR